LHILVTFLRASAERIDWTGVCLHDGTIRNQPSFATHASR